MGGEDYLCSKRGYELSVFALLLSLETSPFFLNEIVIPTILMMTVLVNPELADQGAGAGVMFEEDSLVTTGALLEAGGWTLLTGVNLMLFSLLHNPCSTTIYTIYKETRSVKWTVLATMMPIVMGVVVCFLVAQIWRLAAV